MGRIRGVFTTSNNYEVKKAAPFDARMLVKKKSDLVDSSSWSITGIYNGMIVAVGNDPEKANNGLYMLTDIRNIDSLSSWIKFAELSDLEAMGKNIQNLTEELGLVKAELDKKQDKLVAGKNIIIENNVISAVGSSGGGNSVIQVEKLPEIGEEDTVYCVKNDGSLYMWSEGSWVCYGRDYERLTMLLGGSAN